MKHKTNTKITALLTILVLALNLILPFIGTVSKAATDVTVNIKKVYYEGTKREPNYQTDGKDFSKIPDWSTLYDKAAREKYGEVQFSIYALNTEGAKLVNEDGTAQDALQTDLLNNGVNSKYIEKTALKTATVGDDGIASLAMGSLNETSPKKYAILETKPSKGKLIATPAVPMVVELPYITETGAQNELNIIAKNQVGAVNFKLEKMGEDNKPVAKAAYYLYKGTPAKVSEATKQGKMILTDAKGQLTFEGLTAGDYFLVEVPSENVSNTYGITVNDPKQYQLDMHSLKDKNNTLTFKVDNTGVTYPEKSQFKANGSKPELAKHKAYLTPYARKAIVTPKADRIPGQDIEYRIVANLPGNIESYAKYVIKDTKSSVLGAATGVKVVDPATGVTVTPTTEGNVTTFTLKGYKNTTNRVEFTYKMKLAADLGKETSIKNSVSTVFVAPHDENTGKDEKGGKTTQDETPDNVPGGSEEIQNPPKETEVTPDDLKPNPDGDITPTPDPKVDNPDGGKTGETEMIFGKVTIETPAPGTKVVISRDNGGKTEYLKEDGTWTENKDEAEKYVSDGTGKIEVPNLPEGKYNAEITDVPEGYKMPIPNNKDFEITKEKPNPTVKFSFNKLTSLPLTGSEQLIILGVFGIVIIATGAVILKKRNK